MKPVSIDLGLKRLEEKDRDHIRKMRESDLAYTKKLLAIDIKKRRALNRDIATLKRLISSMERLIAKGVV